MVNSNKNLLTHGFELKLKAAKAGAEKYLPQNTALELSGKETTVAQVVLDFAAVLAKYQDVRDAVAAVAQKRQVLHDSMTGAHAEYSAFKSYLIAKLGKGNPELAEFGFTLGVPKPKSAGTKVLAAIKAQHTRKVRHTLGRKQRLALSAPTGPSVLLGPDGKPVSATSGDVTASATPTAPAVHTGGSSAGSSTAGGSSAGGTSGPGASPTP
jgi:hypothetical protein